MLPPDSKYWILTIEGAPAVQEAIDFLNRTTPVAAMKWNDILYRAAKAHVEDTGPKGLIQHENSLGQGLRA